MYNFNFRNEIDEKFSLHQMAYLLTLTQELTQCMHRDIQNDVGFRYNAFKIITSHTDF